MKISQQDIQYFIQRTGADEATAIAYLEAEEGFIYDALFSYRADKNHEAFFNSAN